jgi:hypothetical protein
VIPIPRVDPPLQVSDAARQWFLVMIIMTPGDNECAETTLGATLWLNLKLNSDGLIRNK